MSRGKKEPLGDPVAEEPAGVVEGLKPITDLVGAIAGAAAFLGAGLFYFGWVRTETLFAYFRVPTDAVGFGAQQLALRSVTSIFDPVLWCALAVVSAVPLSRRLRTLRVSTKRNVRATCRAAGVALLLLGIEVRYVGGFPTVDWPIAPAILCVAAILFFLSRNPIDPTRTRRDGLLEVVGWWALLATLSFWLLGGYAEYKGLQLAKQFEKNRDLLAPVVIVTKDRLSLSDVSGVVAASEKTVGGLHSYSKLRLLAVGERCYFVLPDDWSRGRGAVICIPKDAINLLEFLASNQAAL